MIRRSCACLALSFCLMAGDDPFTGTWKLNLSKSSIPAPLPHSQIARVRADDSGIHISEEIVSDTGERTVIEVDARFDGKDYPIKGSPFADTVAYERVDRCTIRGVGKKAGKVIMNETVTVTADGKTLRGVYTTADASGKQVKSTAVFDRQ